MTALRAHIFVVAAIISGVGTTVLHAQHPSDRPAVVTAKKAEFYFPRPYRQLEAPIRPPIGYFAWRINVEGGPKFSVALYTPKPVRTDNDREIVASAILRACPSTESPIHECTLPINGKFWLDVLSIHIELYDERIIKGLRRFRPLGFWRAIIEPGGHYEIDQRLFVYPRF